MEYSEDDFFKDAEQRNKYRKFAEPNYEKAFRWALESIPKPEPNAEVIDIGCGFGISTQAIADHFKGAKFLAIDTSTHLHEASFPGNTEFKVGSVDDLLEQKELELATFSFAFMSFVPTDLEHGDEKTPFLDRADDFKNVLKHDGIGVFVHCTESCLEFLSATFQMRSDEEDADQEDAGEEDTGYLQCEFAKWKAIECDGFEGKQTVEFGLVVVKKVNSIIPDEFLEWGKPESENCDQDNQ